jgi:hypothetical protein
VAESDRVKLDMPLRYRDVRVSPDKAKALLISARARVVPEMADDSGDETWEVGRDGSAERTNCTFGPCKAGFGILMGVGAAFFKYASVDVFS